MSGDNDLNDPRRNGGHLPMLALSMNAHKNTPTAEWCWPWPFDAECRAREEARKAAQAAKRVAEENKREEARWPLTQAEMEARNAEFEAKRAAERAAYAAKVERQREREREREDKIREEERIRRERKELNEKQLDIACAALPDGVDVKQEMEIKNGEKVIVTTMKVSRPAAFELVRQALAACPGVKETNAFAMAIRDYVHKHKPSWHVSENGARMLTLQEMAKEWTGVDLKVHQNLFDKVFYKQDGADVGLEVVNFIMCTILVTNFLNPFTLVYGALIYSSVLTMRIDAALKAANREEDAKEWLTDISRRVTDQFRGEDTKNRWDIVPMRRLFSWIEDFLIKAFTEYYAREAAENAEFKFEYDDDLTSENVEEIALEMRYRAESFFNKSGYAQSSQYGGDVQPKSDKDILHAREGHYVVGETLETDY